MSKILQRLGIYGAIRYEAQWVKKQHVDSSGEWNPDRDEYAVSYHGSKEAAEQAAIAAGKKADQCEWILVAEQTHNGREWQDSRRWTGDWDGAAQETFNAADEED